VQDAVSRGPRQLGAVVAGPPKGLQAQDWMENFPRDAVCAVACRTPGTAVYLEATSSLELYLQPQQRKSGQVGLRRDK